MSITRVPMTVEGERLLKEELERLKHKDRPAVIQAIAEARAFGDLKENAEYHAAREQQSFIEGRIQEVESKLSNAQVIDISKIPNEGKVIFGVKVTLLNTKTEQTVVYRIVGDDEADLKQGKISINAPIARGLIGKLEGDEAVIRTPDGEVVYSIEAVEY